MTYLTQFPSLIPALQSLKITEHLERLKDQGVIATDSDYFTQYDALIKRFNTSEYIPLFNNVPLQEGLSSSEHYNYLFDQVLSDLEVLFYEFININSVLKAQMDIVNDQYLDQVKFSLEDLDTKIENFKIISSSLEGFDNIIYNSFTDLGNLLGESDANYSEFYKDLRNHLDVSAKDILYLDKQDQVVSLPLDTNVDIPFVSVSVGSGNVDVRGEPSNGTTNSDLNIGVVDTNIQNILDAQEGTYWYYNVLKKEVLPEGAHLKLIFDLGAAKTINYFVIQSVASFPLRIDSIFYVDEYNISWSLNDELLETLDTALVGVKKLKFADISARKIILNVTQINSSIYQYDSQAPESTLQDLNRNPGLTSNIALLANQLTNIIQNQSLLGALNLSLDKTPKYETYYHYVFGFDNAYVGRTSYGDNGYFVSKAIEIPRLAKMALLTGEVNPLLNAASEAPIGSFEYDIIKQDFNGNGTLLGYDIIPILPSGTSTIYERLFFNVNGFSCPLRFAPNTGGVTVYRRDDMGIDTEVSTTDTDPIYYIVDQTDGVTSIILSTQDVAVLVSNIFIVKYVPEYQGSTSTYFDQEQIILYLPNAGIEFKINKLVEVPESSSLYLRIVLRNNLLIDTLSPQLGYYKILTTTYTGENS